MKVKEKVRVADRPLGLAELLHACEPLPEVTVLSETVVVGGQLEQFDLSDHLELLHADSREGKRAEENEVFFLKKNPARSSFPTIFYAQYVKITTSNHLSPLLKVDQTSLKKKKTQHEITAAKS